MVKRVSDKELIAKQAHTIKVLRAEAEIYRTRLENVRDDIDYLHEYMRDMKTILNRHMRNPKLYPKQKMSRSEH